MNGRRSWMQSAWQALRCSTWVDQRVRFQTPYGYRYISKHAGGGQAQYQVVFEEARIVKQMFEWVGRDRLTLREVGRRLYAQGIPSPQGKLWWQPTSITRVLANPAYKGTAVYGKTRVGEHRPRLRPRRGMPEHPRRTQCGIRGLLKIRSRPPVPRSSAQNCSRPSLSNCRRTAKGHTRRRTARVICYRGCSSVAAVATLGTAREVRTLRRITKLRTCITVASAWIPFASVARRFVSIDPFASNGWTRLYGLTSVRCCRIRRTFAKNWNAVSVRTRSRT